MKIPGSRYLDDYFIHVMTHQLIYSVIVIEGIHFPTRSVGLKNLVYSS